MDLKEGNGSKSSCGNVRIRIRAVEQYNHGCSDRFSFSNELLSLSLRYTLPAITKDTKKMIEFVTLRFVVPVVDLVMDTLKFVKQASSSSYRESGLELPPCLMRLPRELKLKILEFIANMACVSTEMRHLVASDDGLRKRRAWKKLLAATSTP
ncbi:hypothetical protein Bca4012_005095 [Brassica carinata]|uniref:F-box domain-containing protein n=1 Tax=Brassica carinata TaxID=52824 RepID=A0A8X7RT53_BRACI|nr:hypothetical protein Bca52824_040470 [Brassica carinata]